MKNRIRLFLVDDHPVVRQGLKTFIESYPQFKLVGEAANGKDAIRAMKKNRPDVVLLDLDLPEVNGLDIVPLLKKRHPRIRILILTMHNMPEHIKNAMTAGANGYMLKTCPPSEMAFGIETVFQGHNFYSREISKILLGNDSDKKMEKIKPANLTKRESEILTFIAEGLSNKEMAWKLKRSIRTVECHRENIMRKLNIFSTAQLTKYALSQGIVTL